jgi:two-component system, NtrC family, response regulator GlrR
LGKHILVVDNDTDVLTVLVEMLHTSGFTVTAAESLEAMRAVLADQRASSPIDAVVLDCLLPGGPSAQFFLSAKSLHLPVVMISGSLEAMNFAEENGLQLLAKPFRLDDFLWTIDQALESGKVGQQSAA